MSAATAFFQSPYLCPRWTRWAAGQIESSRHRATVLVRSRPGDRSRGRGRGWL